MEECDKIIFTERSTYGIIRRGIYPSEKRGAMAQAAGIVTDLSWTMRNQGDYKCKWEPAVRITFVPFRNINGILLILISLGLSAELIMLNI